MFCARVSLSLKFHVFRQLSNTTESYQTTGRASLQLGFINFVKWYFSSKVHGSLVRRFRSKSGRDFLSVSRSIWPCLLIKTVYGTYGRAVRQRLLQNAVTMSL